MADRRVLAFAGHGKTTLENARAVLDNWIGDGDDAADIAGFMVPAKIAKRGQPGLAAVVSYLTEDWGGDDEEDNDPFDTHPAEELVNELANVKEADPYLVVILGDEDPDETTANLISQAREQEIPVLDLAAGMDEYTATDDTEPEAAQGEPESDAERPKRRRRTADTSGESKPAGAGSEPPKPRRGMPRIARTADGGHELVQDDLPFDGPVKHASTVFPDTQPDMVELTAAGPDFKATLIVALEGALAALRGELGRPQAETCAYITDEHGKILKRRGRGKPSVNQKVIFLTKDEAAAQGFGES